MIKLLAIAMALSLVACHQKLSEGADESIINKEAADPIVYQGKKDAEHIWVKCSFDNCIERDGFEIWIDVTAKNSSDRFTLITPERQRINSHSLDATKMIAQHHLDERKEFTINPHDKCNRGKKVEDSKNSYSKEFDNWNQCFISRLEKAKKEHPWLNSGDPIVYPSRAW